MNITFFFFFSSAHTPCCIVSLAPAGVFGVPLDGKPIRSTDTSFRFDKSSLTPRYSSNLRITYHPGALSHPSF